MEKIIWTLWWQGEVHMPPVVKDCVNSMKQHSNGAEVIVLDEDNLGNYIEIPTVVKEKFERNKITITHLSDIIRFELLHKYGGLWLDSTVMVSEDIPDWIFEADFYTIKNGTGGDYKNVAKERWTAFILGGKKGNPVIEGVRWLFQEYWREHEKLVCYFLIDFCMNDVYEAVPEAKAFMDAVPDYEGNVFAQDSSMFRKLSWKTPKGNKVINRVKSLMRHIKEFTRIENMKMWGFKIQWYTFLWNCTRTSYNKISMIIAARYNAVISEYWGEGTEELYNKIEKGRLVNEYKESCFDQCNGQVFNDSGPTCC